MKSVLTKLTLFGLIISMILIAAGCAAPTAQPAAPAATTAPAAAGKALKVGFSAITLSDAVIAYMINDMKAAAAAKGFTLSVADCGGDPSKQISDVENMVNAGNDVVIIQPLDPNGLEPIVKAAMAKGVKIVSYGIGLANYDVWYKNDNTAVGTQVGKTAGEWINANKGGTAKVGLIEFPMVPVLVERAKAIEDALKATAPNAQVVAHGSAIDTESGMKLAETFLQQNPDISVIVSISDGPALGAFQAIKAAGKNNDQFGIFGSDVAPEAVNDILANTAYRGTVDTDSKISGKKAIEIADAVGNGKPIDKIITMGATPVTIKNAAEYKR